MVMGAKRASQVKHYNGRLQNWHQQKKKFSGEKIWSEVYITFHMEWHRTRFFPFLGHHNSLMVKVTKLKFGRLVKKVTSC